LQDLICESSSFFEIGQDEIKEALLTLQVQASRSIDTDEARVKGNICIDSVATRLLRRSPRVDTILRDERSIAIENCGLQLPILLPRPSPRPERFVSKFVSKPPGRPVLPVMPIHNYFTVSNFGF
jgi:hypothetical protein